MTRHFLRYWIREKGDWGILDQSFMTYSTSNQYGRVALGDIIWAVIRSSSNQHLILIGRLTVDWIGTKAEATTRVRINPDDTYDANLYVTTDHPEPYDYIDINDYAPALRFVSSSNERLKVVNKLVNPQQLQTIRELHEESAMLMQDIWYDVHQPNGSITTFTEGQPRLRIHIQRERNQALVTTAKQRFKAEHGRLFCEVCGFDFAETYGALGDSYIEAHHRIPFAELNDVVETAVADLAMVCANCHRMLHRTKPWLTIDELKVLLTEK